jgi:hypothetical protein
LIGRGLGLFPGLPDPEGPWVDGVNDVSVSLKRTGECSCPSTATKLS